MKTKSSTQTATRRKGRNQGKKEAEFLARKTAIRKVRTGFWMAFTLRAGTVILVVTLAVAGMHWSGRQLLTLDWFSVKSIEIKGLRHLDKGEVLAHTQLDIGSSWIFFGATRAEKALAAIPGIHAVTVRRAFPSRVILEVVEEEPIVLAHHGYWLALFSDGRSTDGHRWQGKDLPILEGVETLVPQRKASLCDFLGRVKSERPGSFARFSQVTPLSGRDIAVILRDGQARLLLNTAAKSLNSLDFLEGLLREHAATWRTGANIDMRVDDHAYVL